MEPPAKKMKFGQVPLNSDDEEEANLDELSMSPTQFDARQDPMYELDKGRAKAATRLKSAFERIFEKYERDFTDVGDEIDLETGEVIINNGHLQSLQDEKDRAREGSVSSNEEEKLMIGKGKDTQSVDSRSQSLPRANSLPQHTPSLPLDVGSNQIAPTGLATGFQPLPPGMPSDPFGFPNQFTNQFMFGPPMPMERHIDPLWQIPEIPVPLHMDRFGFLSQSMGMGYLNMPGYGYGLMPAEGAYSNRPPNNMFGPQMPKRLPVKKTQIRKPPPRVAVAQEDSEEDDLLLGETTQEAPKPVVSGSKRPSSLVEVTGNVTRTDPKTDIQTTTATTEHDSQKPRRRSPAKPRKAISPSKLPMSMETTNDNISAQENLNSQMSEFASESAIDAVATCAAATSTSHPSTPEESILAKQIITRLAQIKTQTEGLTPGESKLLNDQQKKSSEFYGHFSWMNGHQPIPEATGSSDDTENVANAASGPITLESDKSSEHTIPDKSLHERDVIQPGLNIVLEGGGGEYKEPIEKTTQEVTVQTATATLDEKIQIENSLAISCECTEENKGVEVAPVEFSHADYDSTGPCSIDENPRDYSPLFFDDEFGMKEAEPLVEDNEILVHAENELSRFSLAGENDLSKPQSLSLNRYFNHEDDHSVSFQSSTTDYIDFAADTETTFQDAVNNQILGDLVEAQKSDIASDDKQDRRLDPPTEREQNKTTLPSPVASQEEAQPIEVQPIEVQPIEVQPIEVQSVEVQPVEVDTTKSTLALSNIVNPIASTEPVPNPQPLPEEIIPQPTPEPSVPQTSTKLASNSMTDLVIRPAQAHIESTLPSLEERRPKSSSPSKSRPLVPRTPKKYKEKGAAAEPRSGTHRTPSPKKKYALASLISDDEDELSILSSSVVPSPFYSKPSGSHAKTNYLPPTILSPHKSSHRHHHNRNTTSTPSGRITKHAAPPATDSRASRGTKRRFDSSSGVQSSPLSRTVLASNKSNSNSNSNTYTERGGDLLLASTPSRRGRNNRGGAENSSPVRTPGGSARKCGVDGFICDRDFCFTCCK